MITINNSVSRTRRLVVTAMLAALSAVLMFIEFPLPFIAPPFYKLDLSEIPVLIGSFALGPVSGVVIEAIKIIVKLLIKGTETAFVGELSNFVIGCSLVIPASIIYQHKKTKKNAIIAMTISTVIMTIVGVFLNAFILLPAYSKIYGMPINTIVSFGSAIFPIVKDVFTLCLFCVAPFNLIKGIVVSIVTVFIYKPLSRVIHKEK